MKGSSLIMAIALIAFVAFVPSTYALNMPLNGSWVSIGSGGTYGPEFMTAPNFFNLVSWDNCLNLSCAVTWDWTSTSNIKLDVTDWRVATDRFEVYDNGVLLFRTPYLRDNLAKIASNPDTAWADADFSKGSAILGPGSHSIAIRDIKIPRGYADGTVAFRASAVPEPSTLFLLGAGLAGVGLLRRRFKN